MMEDPFPLLVPLLFAALMITPVPAAGQDVPREKLEEFEQHVAAGATLYKKEQYDQALEQFRQARNIADHPKLSYKIGRTLEQLNRCAKARSAYRRYLDYEGLDDSDRESARKRLEGLDDCKPLGQLDVRCVPETARVAIGKQTFDCPTSVDLEAGSYQLEVSADGHPSRQVEVDVRPDTTREKTVDLTRSSTPPTDWRPYAQWGGIGLGGALLVGGLVSDLSAIARHDRIADAAFEGDTERLDELSTQARTARTRTIILYTSGALLASGGVALYLLDNSSDSSAGLFAPSDDGPRAGVRVGAGHVGAFVRW